MVDYDHLKERSVNDLVDEINRARRNAGLLPIAVISRPSSSGSGNTLEVRAGNNQEILFVKSIHGGAINWFLKGMVAGFGNVAPPKVSNFKLPKLGDRSIDLS